MTRTLTAAAMTVVIVLTTMTTAIAATGCKDAGATGLSANYVNEVPSGSFDVTCDIGIYFDEAGSIDGAEVNGTVADARAVQFGIYVDGAEVDVTGSTIVGEAGYPHQFVSVTYRSGATGAIDGNEVTGAHRAGIVLRGAGTDVTVQDNLVEGSGPKATGWAENGIQIDEGATGTIAHNTIRDHWWDMDNFVSSGLLVFGSDVSVTHNTFTDNDLGVYLFGDRNNFVHNAVEVTYVDPSIDGIYGVFVQGDGNGVRQSSITSEAAEGYGLWVYAGTNNKLIRNSVAGWEHDVIDGGDDTKRPQPFAP